MLMQEIPIDWQPWSTVPKNGEMVLALLFNGEVWRSKWAPDDRPVPDGFAGLIRDEFVVGWREIPI